MTMAIFKKKPVEPTATGLTPDMVPRHVGIIMDGNGRWATQRGLPRTAGHAAGSETFRQIATYCRDIGMDYLTVYAFSTENWKRPADEVGAIMGLLKKYLYEAIEKMERDKIRLAFFGDLSRLSPELQELAADTVRRSQRYEGFQANICLNYGGRDEILRAARTFAARCAAGEAKPEDLDEAAFSGLLYSAGIPDPELIIRPSGEQRLSNFLLWQSAYTEFYYTNVLWPDFTAADLDRAILAFRGRDRRFGGI
jgi:undecaprenyl diphosphate synthase